MATEKASKTTPESEYEEPFPDWVYTVPGALLIAVGLVGLALQVLLA